MKKILLAAALILLTIGIVYAAAHSYPRLREQYIREWEQTR